MSRYQDVQEVLRSRPLRWVVTGVAGFIGSHLLEALLGLEQTVVGLDNFATGKPENLEHVLSRVSSSQRSRFHFVEGDVRDAGACREVVRGANVVLHEAALASVPRSIADPASSHAANVDGFVNVLLAVHAAGMPRLVYASSSSVYGDDPSDFKVETRMGRPLSPYAATKLIDEIYAETFQRTQGVESIGLRYFNVFGPRQDPAGAYAAVIPRWSDNLFLGESCVVFGDGTNSRDFCFVDNVVQANILAASAPLVEGFPRVFNVACGASTTLRDLFVAIRDQVATYHPDAHKAILHEAPPRSGDIAHSLADITRARTCLGYEPEYDLARGLRHTISYYQRVASLRETAPEHVVSRRLGSAI